MEICRRFNSIIISGVLFLLLSVNVKAEGDDKPVLDCFSFVAGKNTTSDGSVIFAHNEDTGPMGVNYYKVPRMVHQPGEEIIMERGARIPQAEVTNGYLWINIPGCDVCDSYVNEYGVAIGSDGCPSREDNPELKDGGIVLWLRRIVAERAHTAREGVKLAGRLIEEYGYASSGRTYLIADRNEGWVFAAVHGKHWVAQRVPDDMVAVIPNQYTIEGIDLSDTLNFLGAADIVDYAIKRGWYDPGTDGKFNFAKAYTKPGSLTYPRNGDHRMWRGLELISGKKYNISRQLPFAVKPSAKLSVQNIMADLRDHYEGPLLDDSGVAVSEELRTKSGAAICHNGTQYSLVAHLRSWLPAEIAPVVWITMYHPDLQTYCAWYPSVTTTPELYRTGDYTTGLKQHIENILTGSKSRKSDAYTRFYSLFEKANSNPDRYIPVIKSEWSKFEKVNFNAQEKFEKKITLMQDHDKTIKEITEYTSAKANEIYNKTEKLISGLSK